MKEGVDKLTPSAFMSQLLIRHLQYVANGMVSIIYGIV